MFGFKQQHDFGREIGQSPQRMKSHSAQRHPDRWIAPIDPFIVRRFLEHHLEGRLGLSVPIQIDLMDRHLEALAEARHRVEEAARQLSETRAGELVAEELRAAQQALSGITGEFTTEDLLGRIFAGFCIGK